ncbi:DUF1517 domain-containing protein [Deinococcus sp. VB343]
MGQHDATARRPRFAWSRRLLTVAACGTLALGGPSLPPAASPDLGMAAAQSGGGFGGSSSGGGYSGGSGGGYSGGGYSGGGYSGGGYSGPIIIGGGGGYYGGGMGFGGGMGIVPLIIFGVVVFMVVGGMRRSLGGGARGLGSLGSVSGTAQALSVQLLLAEGDEVKSEMRRIAREGDPDTNAGLARMVQEAALVALRHPERWVYGNVERAQGAASSAANQVGAWATEARAAFQEQTTSNYQNQDPNSGFQRRTDYSYNKEAGDLYLAVTIAVAAHTLGNLPPAGATTAAEARAALLAISGITEGDLIRAEVIWSPDTEGEFLSEDEAIVKYPKLSKL